MMRIKNLNNKAFSLLEILLASIIFIITVAGIFATLSAVRTPVADRESALTAAVFGKQVLENLRSQVNAASSAYYYSCSAGGSPCPDFALSLGAHQISQATLTTYGLSWPASLTAANGGASPVLKYTVVCADGSSPCSADSARQVNLTINW